MYYVDYVRGNIKVSEELTLEELVRLAANTNYRITRIEKVEA